MVATALAHVSQPAPPLPDTVPEPLRTTVMAGLAKHPSQRPESAAAFAEALRMPRGTAPEHLVAGAESAVAPVVVGVTTVTPEPGATSFVTLSPATPPAPAVVPGRRARWARRRDGRRADAGRPAWLVPAVVVVGAVLVAVALVVTLAGGALAAPRGAGEPRHDGAHAAYLQARQSIAAPTHDGGSPL
jgi:serine/threonine-protein kinase